MTHPFKPFVPRNARYLLLGSFTGKLVDGYDWYYSNGRNHFWPIIEAVYDVSLPDKNAKMALFSQLKLGVYDIIYQAERKRGVNLDNNLVNIVYTTPTIEKILRKNIIEKIFFSSRFVENKFRKIAKHLIAEFPEVELIILPSPSPRYARMAKEEKIRVYRKLLPKLI